MIKFVRNHIFIVCFTSFILASGLIVLWQTNQAKATGVDYNTISEQTSERQVASYSLYLALNDCIQQANDSTPFFNKMTDNSATSIFNSDYSVQVGYIAEKLAVSIAGADG